MSRQIKQLLDSYEKVVPLNLFKSESPEADPMVVDPSGLLECVKNLDLGSKAVRQSIWEVYSALPVTDAIRSEIKKRLNLEIKDFEVDGEQNEGSISANIPQRVYLPFGKMPQVDTYLRASRANQSLELPHASLFVLNPDGSVLKTLKLNTVQTAITMSFIRKEIANIRKNRESFELDYQNEMGLSSALKIDFEDVKNHFLKKHLQVFLKDLGLYEGFNFNGVSLDIRFSQIVKGNPSPEIREVVDDNEKLGEFFSSRIPEMISSRTADPYLAEDSFAWQQKTGDGSKIPTYSGNGKNSTFNPNELQLAMNHITRATRSGHWKEAVGLYIKYLEYWPQYLQHRISVLDLIERVKKGVIPEYPTSILSIASGPHEELRAQWEILKQNPEIKMPEVFNLDSSEEMLNQSSDLLEPECKKYSHDKVGDMRNPDVFGDKVFDLVECSSFDNLKVNSDVVSLIRDSFSMIKPNGGLVRFHTLLPFSKEFFEVLEKHGVTILEKSSKPVLNKRIRDKISKEKGNEVLERINYKLARQYFFFAKINTPIDLPLFEKDLNNVSVFEKEKTTKASGVKQGLTNAIEAELFDFNIFISVALNPIFFLERKHLNPDYLKYALTQLKGKIDYGIAKKILKIFFLIADNDKLNDFKTLAWDLLEGYNDLKEKLNLSYLSCENHELADRFKRFVIDNLTSYFDLIVSGSLPIKLVEEICSLAVDRKTFSDELLSRNIEKIPSFGFSKECVEKIFSLVNERGFTLTSKVLGVLFISDRSRFDKLYSYLPVGVKFEIDGKYRFDDFFSDAYFKYAKDVSTDSYNLRELKYLLSEEYLIYRLVDKKLLENTLKDTTLSTECVFFMVQNIEIYFDYIVKLLPTDIVKKLILLALDSNNFTDKFFANNIGKIVSMGVSKDFLKRIFGVLDNEKYSLTIRSLNALIKYDIELFTEILEFLPKGLKLKLDAKLRFDEKFSDAYIEFSIGSNRDYYSRDEIYYFCSIKNPRIEVLEKKVLENSLKDPEILRMFVFFVEKFALNNLSDQKLLLKLFELLPNDFKFKMPVNLRFSELFRDKYFENNTRTVDRKKYSAEEVFWIFSHNKGSLLRKIDKEVLANTLKEDDLYSLFAQELSSYLSENNVGNFLLELLDFLPVGIKFPIPAKYRFVGAIGEKYFDLNSTDVNKSSYNEEEWLYLLNNFFEMPFENIEKEVFENTLKDSKMVEFLEKLINITTKNFQKISSTHSAKLHQKIEELFSFLPIGFKLKLPWNWIERELEENQNIRKKLFLNYSSEIVKNGVYSARFLRFIFAMLDNKDFIDYSVFLDKEIFSKTLLNTQKKKIFEEFLHNLPILANSTKNNIIKLFHYIPDTIKFILPEGFKSIEELQGIYVSYSESSKETHTISDSTSVSQAAILDISDSDLQNLFSKLNYSEVSESFLEKYFFRVFFLSYKLKDPSILNAYRRKNRDHFGGFVNRCLKISKPSELDKLINLAGQYDLPDSVQDRFSKTIFKDIDSDGNILSFIKPYIRLIEYYSGNELEESSSKFFLKEAVLLFENEKFSVQDKLEHILRFLLNELGAFKGKKSIFLVLLLKFFVNKFKLYMESNIDHKFISKIQSIVLKNNIISLDLGVQILEQLGLNSIMFYKRNVYALFENEYYRKLKKGYEIDLGNGHFVQVDIKSTPVLFNEKRDQFYYDKCRLVLSYGDKGIQAQIISSDKEDLDPNAIVNKLLKSAEWNLRNERFEAARRFYDEALAKLDKVAYPELYAEIMDKKKKTFSR